jgi:polyhydroxyalkanoate synthesis regulator phasin
MLTATVRKMMLMGIGALSLSRERAEMLVKELTEKGEVDQAEARTFVGELVRRGEQERSMVQKAVRSELSLLRSEFGLVNRRDLSRIEARLGRIEKHLDLPPVPADDLKDEDRTRERLQRIEEHLNLPSLSAEEAKKRGPMGETTPPA